MECTQLSLFGKMYQERSVPTAERTSAPFWKNLPAWNSQTLLFLDLRGGADGAKPEQSPEPDGALLGDCSTLNIGESPSVESESLLSQILEANAPLKYYLSERACQGILTRASRRGKKLPDLLQTALLEMIEWWRGGAERSLASHSGPQVMESYGIGNGQAHASVTKEKSGTLDTMHDAQAVAIEHMELPKKIAWIVRRLTPTECERLQGYPDGWTDIGEWTDTKGKKHKAADSPRYKALGNSIALPQWFWIVQKMKPYMGDGAKLGSLFDGIGGFPLVWETTYGAGTAAWASEIEEFPIAVTKKWFGEKEVKS